MMLELIKIWVEPKFNHPNGYIYQMGCKTYGESISLWTRLRHTIALFLDLAYSDYDSTGRKVFNKQKPSIYSESQGVWIDPWTAWQIGWSIWMTGCNRKYRRYMADLHRRELEVEA